MLTKVASVTNYGLQAIEIEVEVDVADKGFPGFNIVGLASKAIEESKDRIKTAIINSDIEFPTAKITVNLAPADMPKEGACYDLPIALGILNSLGTVKLPKDKSYFYGELSLDGSLRHNKGVILLALLAKEQGVKSIFVPRLAANEACVVEGLAIYPVDSLTGLIKHLNGMKPIKPLVSLHNLPSELEVVPEFDFREIKGQMMAKRALEIAAAGGHNLLMTGPPGSGKTMLARALPGILPPLTEKESLEVSKIYSITGNIPPGGSLVRQRPYRSPHHTISQVGLIGGGSPPRPGEISLSHRGILFLDEFAEFSRGCLEALRQPMEDGKVQICRASGSIGYPSQFMLVAAANPCPCGFLGDKKKHCQCSLHQISNYQKKLSGPILDRIDLHISVPAVEVDELMIKDDNGSGEESKTVRERVMKAREVQKERFCNTAHLYDNAHMKNKQIKEFSCLSLKSEVLLKQAANKFGLSARSFFRTIRISRTIADLEGSAAVEEKHVAEALQFRVKNVSVEE